MFKPEPLVEEETKASFVVKEAVDCQLVEISALSANAEIPAAVELSDASVGPELSPATRTFAFSPPVLDERYRIIDFVGAGGMGTVWKAFDRELNDTIAIKSMRSELLADQLALSRFKREAELATTLAHVNIAAVYGSGTDVSGHPYIVMQYVEGDSLAEIISSEGKLPEARALDIFRQLCEALVYAHSSGVLHRDIKPSNVIIAKSASGEDIVKLVDFGIASGYYDERGPTQALTQSVGVLGSLFYMSPEQLLGQEVTPRSDIYSLGCVLYEMLAGRPPFNDKNTATLIMRQLQDLPESDGFSARTTAILGKCLGKVVFYRAESAATLLKMLDDKSTTPAFELNLSQLVCYVIAFVNIMATAIPTEISLFPLCLLWLLWFSDFAINCWKPHCSREQRQVEFRWFFLLFCFGMAVVLRAMFGAIVAPLAYCLLLLPIVLYSMRAQEFYLSLTNRLNDQNRKAFFARQRRGKSSLELTDCLPSSVRYWLPFFCVIQMVGLTLLPFDLILPNAVDLLRADHFSMIFFGALISLFLLAIGLSWLKPYFQAGHKLSVWIKVIAFNLLCCIMMHTAFIYFPLQSLVFKVLHKSQSVGDQRAFLKEVASYPDDYFGLEAKSLATKYFNDDINKSAKVELCNQIIASKSKFKNWCLADAYVYKLKNSDLTSGDRQQWLNLWDIADKEVQQANGEHGFMSSERSVNLQRYELFQQALQLNALDRAEKTLDAIEADHYVSAKTIKKSVTELIAAKAKQHV